MTKTCEDVELLGLYVSDCCGVELIFDTGDTFTRCPRCQGLCDWELVETLVTTAQLESLETEAA